MTHLAPVVDRVTDRIIERSKESRAAYLEMVRGEAGKHSDRSFLSCSNLAHGFAASGEDKGAIAAMSTINIGIVTAFNDMLSAHQPYGRYPEQMKLYAREVGATAQVAGGVPAMCDGVTQGFDGMELSLFSRDTIALSTAVALSHAMFDGMTLLGICDKIVPGLVIGALRFGHLPAVFIPSGPMPSGISNKEKQKTRQLYAEGKVGREELLASESASYHSAGTCTFYGTANSNQMMMEMMGLHMPGAAFVPPNTPLRQAVTRAATHRVAAMSRKGDDYRPMAEVVDEKAIVNAMVGLLATGGSTNHAIHIPAMARAAGILVDWQDLSELSSAVPLLTRVYPNGSGDVNHFHAAGGMAWVVRELLDAGLAHEDVLTIAEGGMRAYATEPTMDGDQLTWKPAPETSGDDTMLRTVAEPFQPDGGMRLVEGNIGRATFKTSAVEKERWTIEAPCRVFETQEAVSAAFKAGELDRDVVVVVRFQGPRANGMPELHKLTPPLGILQDRGYKVALVTDGRMSGASGKVPAAIHVTPEALADVEGNWGPLAYLQDGDIVKVCAETGELSTTADLASRAPAEAPKPAMGMGRELFAMFRLSASGAEQGGSAMLQVAGL
ncbi:phosphogluconate dehydratase [Novosphingobium decolorationis]|uniref:Phosphogluconate dehydratase n=1 Tax=Novosphingobium decolorationis TaxID=2698673 RepID=A0ABX8E8W4_9SPHN|nr:phosphogluconate dehydratase [Novosphingobium decolorationis]MED5544511.1 phosphogluconate dehydratase [Pseudomonadota bacterium]QVM85462.1 phosphogluconate dehydratase [Novosphingobium decolorationis]